jgi:hypothetical protein
MKHGAKLCWGVCVLAFLWLALDGTLHWDEPAYLYTGGYLSFQQIIQGDFQPSGIKHFYLTRPLHILMIHAVTAITGVGVPGLIGVIVFCTTTLVGFLIVTALILRELMPGLNRVGTAMALGLLIPVVPYLAFKTLPESAALFCAASAMYALIRAAKTQRPKHALAWLAAASITIMMALWFKGPMLLLLGSGIPAIVLFGGREAHQFKLITFTLIAVGTGWALAYLGVILLGIDPSIYTIGVSRVGGEYEPITARILNNGTPPGLFLIALPLALLSSRRREAALFLTWFLLAAVPLALLFPSMEARYQAPNVTALIGLTALALHGIVPRLQVMWDRRRLTTAAGLTATALFVVFSHTLAIAVMQHEVKIGHVQRTLDELDNRYGEDGYALLSSWTYSDFLYLRYVYPDRPVFTTHRIEAINKDNLLDDLMRSTQEDFFPDRAVQNPEQMQRLDGRVPVLFGFHENFAAANLRSIFSNLPGDPMASQLAKMNLNDHLATSWLWDNPDYELVEVVRVGHYRAFEVRPTNAPTAPATTPSPQ